MDFYINRNSTLPTLKMRLMNDGETDFKSFNGMLDNAVVTFSMVSVDTKTFKIANKSGEIVVKATTVPDIFDYYVRYCFSEKDTNKTGTYLAEFKIDFLDPNCGSLIVPIKEKLYIHIQDSITKTEIRRL